MSKISNFDHSIKEQQRRYYPFMLILCYSHNEFLFSEEQKQNNAI